MYEDCRGVALKDLNHVVLGDLCLTLHDYLITLDRYNLTGILIHEVLIPALKHTGSKALANVLLQVGLVHLHLVCKFENLQDVLVSLETDSTQKGCHWQLLLTVDIGVHDIVDVGGELNPRALERNDTCRIKQRTISMNTLTEEYAR